MCAVGAAGSPPGWRRRHRGPGMAACPRPGALLGPSHSDRHRDAEAPAPRTSASLSLTHTSQSREGRSSPRTPESLKNPFNHPNIRTVLQQWNKKGPRLPPSTLAAGKGRAMPHTVPRRSQHPPSLSGCSCPCRVHREGPPPEQSGARRLEPARSTPRRRPRRGDSTGRPEEWTGLTWAAG